MPTLIERLRSNFPKKADCVEAANELERLMQLLKDAKVSIKKKDDKQKVTLMEGNKYYTILSAFAEHADMTTDEMGEYTGLDQTTHGWWVLVSHLKDEGYLTDLFKKRLSRAGGSQSVYKISFKGKDALEELGYGK